MAVKSWSIDPNKTGSLNDGGRKLKVGTFAYKITGCKSVIDKNDPTGNTQQVEIGLSLVSDPSYATRVFLSVMSDNDQQREIAHKTLVAFAAAAGIGGTITPQRLPSFVGKTVVINARPPFNTIKILDTGPITNHVNFADNAKGKFAYVDDPTVRQPHESSVK